MRSNKPDYSNDESSRRQRRPIDFSDSDRRDNYDGRYDESYADDFGSGYPRDNGRDYRDDYRDYYREPGQRDEDWADEREYTGRKYDDRRYADETDDRPYYERFDDEPEERPASRGRDNRRTRSSRRGEDYYDRPYYHHSENNMDDNFEEEKQKPRSFTKRHPVIMNILYIALATVAVGWLMMIFLDFWTFHGEERVVPDTKNLPLYSASNNIEHAGLHPVVTDSVYDSFSKPGTVVEQTPVPGARIKKGGTVYLTIVAFTPKMVTVPDFYNISVRQARSLLEGLGISKVLEEPVPSEYQGLVLGARFNGVDLHPGARIPVSAVVTLEVGTGMDIVDEGAPIDSAAIEEVIESVEQLDIE